MSDSTFNSEEFLDVEVQGQMETAYTPIPEGEYPAFIKDLKSRDVNDQKVIDIVWQITDEQVAAELSIDEPTVRQTIFLDLEESGALQFGPNKNVQLGRLREALGQNNPNEPWSFRRLVGAGPCILKVGHRVDKNDPSKVYNDVQRVTSQ